MSEELSEKLNELKKLENEIIESSRRFYEADKGHMYSLDLFAIAVNSRATSLLKGYITLAEQNNYTAAISLIRLQLDNALRLFASTQVTDSTDFVLHFLDGKEIRNYKDSNGNQLTDSHLAKEVNKYFKGTYKLYKDACGYIHLSEKHFFQSVFNVDEANRVISFVIGNTDNYTNDNKINFTKTMIEVTTLVLIMIEQWKHEKTRLGKMREK